jgi:hypothetical protein
VPRVNDADAYLLRHFVATLGYRAGKVIHATPADFAEFSAGHGVRKPVEIVSHMSAVLAYALTFLGGPKPIPSEIGTWDREVHRFCELLRELDRSFESGAKLAGRTEEQLLQGPLADVMTHIGQLAMLRRMAGAPIPKESFDEAAIRIGDLSFPNS